MFKFQTQLFKTWSKELTTTTLKKNLKKKTNGIFIKPKEQQRFLEIFEELGEIFIIESNDTFGFGTW
jgi:hypothetical protein